MVSRSLFLRARVNSISATGVICLLACLHKDACIVQTALSDIILFLFFSSQVDEQFHRFLANFFELHSEFKGKGNKSRPIFFTGESHAGHYIPSMVAYILEQNEAALAAGQVKKGVGTNGGPTTQIRSPT